MRTNLSFMTSSKLFPVAAAIITSGFLAVAAQAASEPKQDAEAASQSKAFDTPKQAADNLLQASETFDVPGLKEILGPHSEDLVDSEDPVMDKNHAAAFVAKAKEKNTIEIDKKDPNRAILSVGNDDLTFPIPIVKQKREMVL